MLRTSGTKQLSSVVRYQVDPVDKAVRAVLAGGFESRAVYREGRGCTLVHGDAVPAAIPPEPGSDATTDPLQAPEELVQATDPAIEAAIDRAFAWRARSWRRCITRFEAARRLSA